jgi:hypothetical protein
MAAAREAFDAWMGKWNYWLKACRPMLRPTDRKTARDVHGWSRRLFRQEHVRLVFRLRLRDKTSAPGASVRSVYATPAGARLVVSNAQKQVVDTGFVRWRARPPDAYSTGMNRKGPLQ